MPPYKSSTRLRLFKRISQLRRELKLKFKINKNEKIKLIIGAGGTHFNSWISTDKDISDIAKLLVWEKYFRNKKIDNILAEHVFEHLKFKEVI